MKKIASSGGKLTKHEEDTLQGLERDLLQVKKAREALGDKAPTFSRNGPRPGGQGVLGKRRRDQEDVSSDDEAVPDDVKNIPMPRDTPPPISKEVLDQWYAKRRAKRANANDMPLGDGRGRRVPDRDTNAPAAAPAVPVVAQTVYEAKPVLRDLKKEAVSAFMPTVVRMKLEKSKGQGGLMEPEEADRLEREGYLKPSAMAASTPGPQTVTMEDVEDEDDG